MRYRGAVGTMVVVWAAVVPRAAAINIVPVFNAADNETPAFDLFNNGIQNLFDHAETYYQDIFEDAGYTLTINFWYEDLEENILGFFSPVTEVGNRLTEANIRIDTREGTGGPLRDWYIDSTPATDGEFEMAKDLWDDADSSLTLAFVAPANTPGAFEIGYRGTAVQGSAAQGKYDMLSTVLHEVGHALGIRGGAEHENADGDYDINPDFLFGVDVAAKIDTEDGAPDPGHVSPSSMLMCGECGAANVRRRPSHADLFVIATSAGLTTLDVPRREFYGGGVFNTAANWSGGRTPDPNDEAFIRDAGLVVMNAGDTVGGLTISHSQLATGSNNLTVNGTLRVESRFFNVLGKLVVGNGSTTNADDVEIARNGEIDVVSGTLSVADDLDLLPRELGGENDGLLSGAGTVNVVGTLFNRGTIKPESGTLTITAGSFNLGGAPSGFGRHVDATTGSVVFNGPHTQTFKGTINVGFAQLVTFSNAWTLDTQGEVTISDGGLINNAAWQADGVVEINHTVPFGIVGVGGTGSMTLGPTGQITTTGAVDFLGPATIQGSLNVTTASVRFSGGGTFADAANVTLDAGTALHVTQANVYTIETSANFAGQGVLAVGGLATLVLEHGVELGTPLVNQGRVEIGTSPAEAHVASDFLQDATGTIEFEIGGHIQGRHYDHLDVAFSQVTLAGTLELAVINGFVPLPGDTFQIITANNLVGEFMTLVGAQLANGSFFDVVYSATSVVLEVISGLPGDYNNNGTVDAADYVVWRDNEGTSNPLPNDPLGGTIGQAHYNQWRAHFGQSAGSGSGGRANAAIPEPGALILACTGLVAMSWAVRRRETLV